MEPEVSIIIANYNGKEYLERCLSSLNDTLSPNCEVIVADNNSSDGSINLLKEKFSSVQIIELSSNLGFAAANNRAAKHARGKYYVFLNNDTLVTKNWLKELVTLISSEQETAIIQSLLLRPDNSIDSSGDFVDEIGRPYSSKKKDIVDTRPILSARAASMIVRKEVFWQLGGFEEDFFSSFEDVHLGWKAWMMGYRVALAPGSIVYHLGGQTTRMVKSTMNFHSMKNQVCVILLNFEGARMIRNLALLFVAYFPVFLDRRIHQEKAGRDVYTNPINARDVLRTGWWILCHLGSLREKRAVISRARIRSTQDLIDMGLITKRMFEK